MNSLASFFAGISLVLILAYLTKRKLPELPAEYVSEPSEEPICARCLFPFEPGEDHCGACIYAWYPDGITRNQIEARVNAAHSQEK